MNLQQSKFHFETAQIDSKRLVVDLESRTVDGFCLHLPNDQRIEFVLVPAGKFYMGSPETDVDSRDNERPYHSADIAGFCLSRSPISQAQWLSIMSQLPKTDDLFQGAELPVVNVGFEKALEFCQRLSQLSDLEFRLPAEAEWEYACRAGTNTPFYFGESITAEVCNFNNHIGRINSAKEIPFTNGFGLHDMHGNVWEWCADIWHSDYEGAPTDGTVWNEGGDGGYLVQRGGCWKSPASTCRSAFRVGDIAHNDEGIVGLRFALSL